ncbi:SDR family oxidoreductase [Streptomyces sp. WSLK1-5]|uniref:SDR family oxidoreductase n=1 Tax=unclassified Streptomyces TaxID=2593676 RepID=UPI0037A25B8E
MTPTLGPATTPREPARWARYSYAPHRQRRHDLLTALNRAHRGCPRPGPRSHRTESRRPALLGAIQPGHSPVPLLGRREDRLRALADELGGTADGRVLAVSVDLTDAEAVAGAATVTGALGTVDLVVANAGVVLGAPFERAGTDESDRMIDVNPRALLHTTRAFTDGLLATASGGGRADLVHVGSVGGHLLFPGRSVHCATKAAAAVKNIEPGVTATEPGADMRDAGARESLSRIRAGLT